MATNGPSKRVLQGEKQSKANEAAAPVVGGTTNDGKQEVKKKYWRIDSANDAGLLEFFPIFVINAENNEVECRNLEMKFTDKAGKEHTFLFDWLNIYMFVYYTANEELRQQLATRYERKINYIPYNITVGPLSPEEKASGIAKRRVELPVDEVTMMIAREEAWNILMANKGHWKDPQFFRYKGKKH